MAEEFTDLTPEGKKFFRELKKLKKMEVAVGFQAGQAEEENGADLVDIAAYNELGTSGTPARPFMKQSFENHEDFLKNACERVNQTINSGGSMEQALNKLGVELKGLVQSEIVDGDFAPNAEATIKRKKSDKPLIDTGTMRQSVNYVVRERTKG